MVVCGGTLLLCLHSIFVYESGQDRNVAALSIISMWVETPKKSFLNNKIKILAKAKFFYF